MSEQLRSDLVVARYRFRAELRSGWRFIAVSAVILGLAWASAFVALVGARRTSSVFDRLAQATAAPDVMALPESAGATDAITADKLATIPGVAAVAGAAGFFLMRADGTFVDTTVLAPVGSGFATTMDVPVVREGRLPDQSKPDEMFATSASADSLGLRVGDSLDLIFFPGINYHNADQYMDQAPSLDVLQKIGVTRRFTLVGIGVRTSEAADQTQANLFLTKAFYDEVKPGTMYTGFDVRLDQGDAGVPAFESAVAALAPGEPISFTTNASIRASISRVVEPQVLALEVFAALMGLVAVGSWALGANRRARMTRNDDRDSMALGMSDLACRLIDLMRTIVVAAIAAVVACVAAYLGSTVMPVTEARRIEPSPGLDFDSMVLVGGVVVLLASTIVIGSVVTPRLAHVTPRGKRPRRVSRLVHGTLDAPAMTTGIAQALEVGNSKSASATRSAMAGATMGLALIVAVLTFAAGFHHLVSTPSAFGWGYDLTIEPHDLSEDRGSALSQLVESKLESDPRVRGWGLATTIQALVDGKPSPLMAIQQLGGQQVHPTLVGGRPPTAHDEVALGARTARSVGASIGSVVEIGHQGRERDFTVVGLVVLPGVSSNSLDSAALGGGALLTAEGLADAIGVEFSSSDYKGVVDLQPGVSAAEFSRELVALATDSGFGDNLAVAGPGLPAVVDNPVEPPEIVAFRAVQSTPLVLALLVAALAAATVGSALITSVRRRQREFGTLQALGFTRRQVRATVAWHATTTAVVASLIGIPLGLIVGRQAWKALADRIGVVDHLAMPWLVLALTVPLAVLAANIVAAVPARVVARSAPAESIRDE
jgi:FtsX-like permease family